MAALKPESKVFGIGLSKTGTLTLAKALSILGIRAVHFPHDETTFDELKRADYRFSILSSYGAITDTPVAPFYPQLDRVWPNSRFILTVREKQSWLASAEDHWRLLKKDGKRAQDQEYQKYVDFINACVYGCIYFDRERFSYCYDRHLADVTAYFAGRPDDLLVFDICGGDQWEKICAFLEVPIPEGVPFPHVHRNTARYEGSFIAAALQESEYDGESVILIDEGALHGYFKAEYAMLPFLERNGVFWGLPGTDAEGIEEIERMRREHNAAYLAISKSSLWVMDHYKEMADYLKSHYKPVASNADVCVFDLR